MPTTEIAAAAGVSERQARDYKTGRSKPTGERYRRLLRFYREQATDAA